MTTHQSTALPEPIKQALTNADIMGFNAITDAIRDTRNGRIYYVKNEAMHWTAPPSRHQQQWLAPGTVTPSRLNEVLSDADSDDMNVIDKTVFNSLVNGPLQPITHVHDGLAWAITITSRHRIERGEKPHRDTVKAVPGIGEKLTEKIMKNFDEIGLQNENTTQQTNE